MSELIVIGYPDKETAGKVLDELRALEKDDLIDLDDAALIVRSEKGKFRVTTTDHGSTVLQTSLSHEAEEKLMNALQGEKAAAS